MSVAGQPGQNASERAGLVGREMLTVAHVAMLADLSDDRRDKKPWLPADDRDVTNGLVVADEWGKPACVKHGAMNRVDRVNRYYRCSEQYCGVGAQVIDEMAQTA